ncbi:YegP family protein [Amycolatopsis sacchari]|uniref:Uncharacterized conserved protein YegP, UPF0339 family n=1 Tax=Amycolatopsis sacchari TaxID=115433 RepID=A0A1I4AUB7_9PSEU|nr:YegP family protein [Amycolatopsis sacchari]SFK60138.1 Uncharacterized conserved protein YegP, UPF0339 family [Amycolatopsis sacchari]
MKFKISPSGAQWYFRIFVTGNSHVLATSELYHNKADARHAAQLIIDNAGSGYIEE